MLRNAVFRVFPSLCGKVWKYFHDENKSNDLSIDDVTEILHSWRDRSFRCLRKGAFEVFSSCPYEMVESAINHRNPRTQSQNFPLKLSLNETTDGRWCTFRCQNPFSSLPLNFKPADFFSPFRLLHHFQQTKDASFVIMNEKSVFQKALKSWLFCCMCYVKCHNMLVRQL